ncbi:MAG: hypothetical protein JRD68_01735 [Deltaproteobacteria bacterium]|nr:hypothetical protein [Deltaproteobacteria bacterium]
MEGNNHQRRVRGIHRNACQSSGLETVSHAGFDPIIISRPHGEFITDYDSFQNRANFEARFPWRLYGLLIIALSGKDKCGTFLN